MRARLTYIPTEVAEQFSDFIIEKDEEVLSDKDKKIWNFYISNLRSIKKVEKNKKKKKKRIPNGSIKFGSRKKN